jgi:hypothetical protein
MIFNAEPWYNEPGREAVTNKTASERYNQEIRRETIRLAMVEWLNCRLAAPEGARPVPKDDLSYRNIPPVHWGYPNDASPEEILHMATVMVGMTEEPHVVQSPFLHPPGGSNHAQYVKMMGSPSTNPPLEPKPWIDLSAFGSKQPKPAVAESSSQAQVSVSQTTPSMMAESASNTPPGLLEFFAKGVGSSSNAQAGHLGTSPMLAGGFSNNAQAGLSDVVTISSSSGQAGIPKRPPVAPKEDAVWGDCIRMHFKANSKDILATAQEWFNESKQYIAKPNTKLANNLGVTSTMVEKLTVALERHGYGPPKSDTLNSDPI